MSSDLWPFVNVRNAPCLCWEAETSVRMCHVCSCLAGTKQATTQEGVTHFSSRFRPWWSQIDSCMPCVTERHVFAGVNCDRTIWGCCKPSDGVTMRVKRTYWKLRMLPLLLIALMYIAAITGQQKQLRHIPFLPFPVVNTCIHAFVCIVMLYTSVLYNRVMCPLFMDFLKTTNTRTRPPFVRQLCIASYSCSLS